MRCHDLHSGELRWKFHSGADLLDLTPYRRGIASILAAPVLCGDRVLVGANMPAVLIEMGFISNPDQEQAFLSQSFQASIVAALVESVVEFQARIGNLSAVDTLSNSPTPNPQ